MENKELPGYWEDFRICEVLQLDEAAALLGGCNPHEVDDAFCLDEKARVILRELKLAAVMDFEFGCDATVFRVCSWGRVPFEERGSMSHMNVAPHSTASVSALAKWADKKGLPHHWPCTQSDKATESAAELETAKAEIEALKARAESVESQVAELEASPFSARERNNMLRIIRALSEMAGLPERGGAPSVEKQLQQLGFTSPKDGTIRKVLADAAKMEPDGKP